MSVIKLTENYKVNVYAVVLMCTRRLLSAVRSHEPTAISIESLWSMFLSTLSKQFNFCHFYKCFVATIA